jgi:hypothetical protein
MPVLLAMAQPSIPTRQLGRDGPTIPILGLGLMGLSSMPLP